MKRSSAVLLVAVLAAFTIAASGLAQDSASVLSRFEHPTRDDSTGPLWTWNDLLTEEQVRSALRDLAGQQIKQVWVHPRPGLMTPYLSEDWFKMWAASLDEAEKLDMNVWIYDENSYPSGFAGGLVPEALPDSRCMNLLAREQKGTPEVDEDTLAVYLLSDSGFENVTDTADTTPTNEAAQYLVVSRKYGESAPWFGGKWYVDLLKPGVTEKFLEVTLEPYRKRFGEEFGRRIPGVFTDEPNLFRARGAPWTPALPELFEKRWGYSLIDNLPCLFRPLGDWRRVRHNYFQLLMELFVERWARPYYEYCEKYSLEFTGHYWEHGWPNATHAPDSMAMYAWHHRPAIDTLFNNYEEHTGAQFGNVRAVRELASVANQMGRKRTLCEVFGGAGWDLRLEDMKRIGDWLLVLGVNTLNEHIAPVTIRGARKRDYPQSFSYFNPWFEAYHELAGYFTRLSVAMSAGEQVNDILVIEPTTTAWMHQSQYDPGQKQMLDQIGASFFDVLMGLERAQVAYDIGSEDLMARWGKVAGNQLVVGKRSYRTVVVPPMTENLNRKTVELLEAYVAAGGTVYSCGEAPRFIEGRASNRAVELARTAGWHPVETATLADTLAQRSGSPVRISRSSDDPGILFHHVRVLEDGLLLLLVNTSIDGRAAGSIQVAVRGGVSRWDPHTGESTPYPYEVTDHGAKAGFEMPPCGSLLLFISQAGVPPAAPPPAARSFEQIPAQGEMLVSRMGPNVLTLDFVDVSAGGESRQGVYAPTAGDFVFQRYGMAGNPWSRAVQFRDELITKRFSSDSGFTATYRFSIQGTVPQPLHVVIERPDLYTITCNGYAVKQVPGEWWVEKAFGKVDISSAARTGDNEVTITAKPLTIWHELEPVYILGEFALQPTSSGFTIVPPVTLSSGNAVPSDGTASEAGAGWNSQGYPFFGHSVAYAQSFQIDRLERRYQVRLGSWYGSAAKVVVNGEVAGYIGWQPWVFDVTKWLKPGENRIEVVVIGSLKNTLGPHHVPNLRGIASPTLFARAPESGPPPGKDYDTIAYGLFEPFLLESVQ